MRAVWAVSLSNFAKQAAHRCVVTRSLKRCMQRELARMVIFRFGALGLFHCARQTAAKVKQFAHDNEKEVQFHCFLQWVADRSLTTAQQAAKDAGMRIGLISDLAVGMSGEGSHAWSSQHDVLNGLQVGAPPDLYNQNGQNWGLTTFSPWALRTGGFAPFIATLRAALRHAGGVRIDHVMGLMRLWVIPDGAGPQDGAYLTYPLDDLLRLTALESLRHRAIVIGEDLGTVPAGFRDTLSQVGIYGMQVLWFERAETTLPSAARLVGECRRDDIDARSADRGRLVAWP